jgi:hypothetical protein
MKRLKKPKEERAPQSDLPPLELDCYEDYVSLIGKTINGVLGRGELKDITRQDAHSIGILTGYGLQALHKARGGQVRMSVFLQDMRSINLDNIPSDQLDRLLQGNEEVQMEILRHYKTEGDTINAEVKPIIKKPIEPKLDTKLLSDMSGIERKEIVKLFDGERIEILEAEAPISKHDWVFTVNKEKRFCQKCLAERDILQPEDITAACSELPGLD